MRKRNTDNSNVIHLHSAMGVKNEGNKPLQSEEIKDLKIGLDALWESGTKERDPEDIPPSDRMLGDL